MLSTWSLANEWKEEIEAFTISLDEAENKDKMISSSCDILASGKFLRLRWFPQTTPFSPFASTSIMLCYNLCASLVCRSWKNVHLLARQVSRKSEPLYISNYCLFSSGCIYLESSSYSHFTWNVDKIAFIQMRIKKVFCFFAYYKPSANV